MPLKNNTKPTATTEKPKPLIPVKEKCPLCELETVNHYAKSKLYKPEQTESDFHIKSYKWEHPEFQSIQPHYYHIWCCKHCYFSDDMASFRGERDKAGKRTLEIINDSYEKIAAAESVIAKLGAIIEYENPTVYFETALFRHLLCLFTQGAIKSAYRDVGKMAKISLRIAWLYRERNAKQITSSNKPPQGYESNKAFLSELKKQWPELPMTEKEAMTMAVERYQYYSSNTDSLDEKVEINTMLLIQDLYWRLGDINNCLTTLNGAFKTVTTHRTTATQVLKKSKERGTTNNLEKIENKVTWLNNSIEKIVERKDKITQAILEKQYPKAVEFTRKRSTLPPEEIEEKMNAAKFHPVTVKMVCERLKKVDAAQLCETYADEKLRMESEVPAKESAGFFKKMFKK